MKTSETRIETASPATTFESFDECLSVEELALIVGGVTVPPPVDPSVTVGQ